MRTLSEILDSSITVEEVRDKYAETAARSAVRALLWSEYDDNGTPFDANYGAVNIYNPHVEALRALVRGMVNTDDDDHPDYGVWEIINRHEIDPESFGHDFILTANSHGAGFWDRGYGQDGDILTDIAKPYGDISLYVGDNGTLYMYGV